MMGILGVSGLELYCSGTELVTFFWTQSSLLEGHNFRLGGMAPDNPLPGAEPVMDVSQFICSELWNTTTAFSFSVNFFNILQRLILIIWMIAFVFGFMPSAVMIDVYDRDRNLPLAYSHWSHCTSDPSRPVKF